MSARTAARTSRATPARGARAGSGRGRPARPLAGLGAMARLVWRRNRVRLAVWVAVIAGMFAYVAGYYRDALDTPQALRDFAAISDLPSIRAITGLSPVADTLGGAVWTKIWMTLAVALALGAAFLVTRNGRADEEAGRTELLRSRMLGIHALSAAAWTWIGLLCLVCGVGVAAASLAFGLDPAGQGARGSWIAGLSLAGAGWVGLGVGALAGQVASTSRGANGLASGVIAAFYVMRMLGDAGDGRLTWASPIGWGEQMQPWAANRWWPLALQAAFALVLLAGAAAIEGRRDLGAGLIVDRPGPADAPARYASPLGLALRLQRGPILGWAIGMVLWSLMLGSVIDAMRDFLRDADPTTAAIVGGHGVDALLAMLTLMTALLATAFALQSATSLRGDEARGILEPELAGAMSRRRWAAERLAIPVVGSAALLALSGAAMGAVYGAMIGDGHQTWRLALAALAYWPAVMVLVGVCAALFGWAPRASVALSWGVLGAMWFVALLGEALRLPDWVVDALPFSATPYLPAEPMNWAPLLVMTGVAAGLAALGVERFVRRDVQAG